MIINIFKGQVILGFVFTAVAQSSLLDFWLTKIFYLSALYSRNVSENVSNKNSSIYLTLPPNLALLFNMLITLLLSKCWPRKCFEFSLFWSWWNKSTKISWLKSVYLLKWTHKSFDIIAVSETRVSKKTSLTCNINLTCGTFLYISNRLQYKPRFDLNIFKKIK